MAYIYQADIYCDTCAQDIKADIKAENPKLVPEDFMDHSSYDSDDYPKSYSPNHEESDSPQNCATCREFLRGGLTTEGYAYLKSILNQHGRELPEHAREWADYYGFSYFHECEVCRYDADECICEMPCIVSEWRSSEM